jgi:sugar phosphate isomerase/epimerase
MKLGLTTWNLASTWDLAQLLSVCRQAGIAGVEPRTTHPHGIEPSLSAGERREIGKRFADAGVELWGLGSVCEFHSADEGEVRRNIETCGEFAKLAADLKAKGVKVRPNGLRKDVPPEKTLSQIGKALYECGRRAADLGVEIWLEIHGEKTSLPDNIRRIMEACGHPAVGICWNSNMTDRDPDGTVKRGFEMLRPHLKSCHITDLDSSYPWSELFSLLKGAGYSRYTLCEYPKSLDPAAGSDFLKNYRRRWLELAA